jgi:hypothetical protein
MVRGSESVAVAVSRPGLTFASAAGVLLVVSGIGCGAGVWVGIEKTFVEDMTTSLDAFSMSKLRTALRTACKVHSSPFTILLD